MKKYLVYAAIIGFLANSLLDSAESKIAIRADVIERAVNG